MPIRRVSAIGQSSADEIEFLVGRFDQICAMHGLVNDSAKARFIGLGTGQYSRVKYGRRRIGGRFIAAVLGAPWRTPVRFEDVFGVKGSIADERAA